MKLDLTDMLYALSFALDKIEAEMLGVDTGHGRRVAYLSLLMGKEAGFHDDELRDFVGCCLLHDNAFTEYIYEELSRSSMSEGLSANIADIVRQNKLKLHHDHSVTGEMNIRLLPFRTDVKNIVLYHHENADGTGVMGMTADKTPIKAQIVHLVDVVDTTHRLNLETMTATELEDLRGWVQRKTGSMFSDETVELFLKAVTYDKIASLRNKGLSQCLREEFHSNMCDYSDEEVRNIADLFAKIIDYKSEFTQSHSKGVADIAEIMADYYGFDAEKTTRFYFAGAMHDIGKLAISNNILEKPGQLTTDEFAEMKNHAFATYHILSRIKGIPDIIEWASNHHEKLNGKGYPRGLTEKELSFEDQLMACVDIYQALTEKRPYKDGMSHEKCISIMMNMASKGELNESIIRDIDSVMSKV